MPQVVMPILSRRPLGLEVWKMPTHCPQCGSRLRRAQDGVKWRCDGALCTGRLRRDSERLVPARSLNAEEMDAKYEPSRVGEKKPR